VYHILWVRGFQGTTISAPGINLFKPLRRHFRATRFAVSLSRREAQNDFVILAAGQGESRTVSRAPVDQMWVRGFRGHSISRRGFNHVNPLRRHFPAPPFCRQALTPRSRQPPAVSSGRRKRTDIERLRNFGKKFVERLVSVQFSDAKDCYI
jgi:hypothetical protein